MYQYRQNMGYRGFNRGRFSPFYTPYNARLHATPVFVIHVPAPVQQSHIGCCSQNMNNYARTYKITKSGEKKAKRASKQLRDRLRREMIIQQNSMSTAFKLAVTMIGSLSRGVCVCVGGGGLNVNERHHDYYWSVVHTHQLQGRCHMIWTFVVSVQDQRSLSAFFA